MENNKPKAPRSYRESSKKEHGDSNREGASRKSSDTSNYSQFMKDKSKGTARTEKNVRDYGAKKEYPRRPASGGVKRDERPVSSTPSADGEERRSFNPNFTKGNKVVGGARKSSRTLGGSRSATGKRAYDASERGRSDGDRKPYVSGDNARSGDGGGRFGDSKKPYPSDGGGRFGDSKDRYKKENKGSKAGAKSDSYPKFATSKSKGDIRLNRYLAMSGISSRRDADNLIEAGVVSVNGVIVTELGTKVKQTDVVKFNDTIVQGESKVYILMNKPKGYVTTIEDPHADKTVMDLLKNACSERIYPVGRLDKSSLGVLLFTNDGDLTRRLTHPSFNKKKIYQVSLDKAVSRADMDKILEGIELEDGVIKADEVEYVGESRREIGIEIHSGRNRVVRRMFEHLDYKVLKLDRVYFAGLTKKNIRRGAWRFLTKQEVEILQSGKYE